jgi:hypothetical protein
METVSATASTKPLILVRVILEVPVELTLIGVGVTALAEILKSATWKRMEAVECDSPLNVPVTVTE